MSVVTADEVIIKQEDGARVARPVVISGQDVGNYKNLVGIGEDGMIDMSLLPTADGGLAIANNLSDVEDADESRENLEAVSIATPVFTPPATNTPANNGELTIELTDDETLTLIVKGSDGVIRSVVLELTEVE